MRLLLGGSPCTFWSIAKNIGRETKAEGFGWELFKNYLIAKELFKPDLFLYENNWSAAQEIKDQISMELKSPIQRINSNLVSAQNRDRFYCHNIPGVLLPDDCDVLIRDILDTPYKEKVESTERLKMKKMFYLIYMVVKVKMVQSLVGMVKAKHYPQEQGIKGVVLEVIMHQRYCYLLIKEMDLRCLK